MKRRKEEDTSTREFFVKWSNLNYEDATWEEESVIKAHYGEALSEYNRRKEATNSNPRNFKESMKNVVVQPSVLGCGCSHRLRDYQLEGLKFLLAGWHKGHGLILADEMGLSKTIQTVALFCHLYEMGVPGPFLVVAPLSTVPNWVNEFKRFSPTVPVVLYHGNQQERYLLRRKL